jgi:hypothetical protein
MQVVSLAFINYILEQHFFDNILIFETQELSVPGTKQEECDSAPRFELKPFTSKTSLKHF